ncbi:MAG: hypothetical protein HYX47_18490 [Burkholderiales bacterium]|nr:hypothetical protein [Burkholderiales bacterium]
MQARFASSLPENAAPARRAMSRPRGPAYMSEKQIRAYLMARDSLRRIRHASSLAAAPPRATR